MSRGLAFNPHFSCVWVHYFLRSKAPDSGPYSQEEHRLDFPGVAHHACRHSALSARLAILGESLILLSVRTSLCQILSKPLLALLPPTSTGSPSS